MRVIVTGAGGLVGRAMVKRFNATPLKHEDLDVRQAAAVRKTVAGLKPDLIINCAVLGVDQSEENPSAAEEMNVEAPGYLAEAADQSGAALLHFSTNYVFDGRERLVYEVNDPPNPINVYGRTKLTGECAVFFRCSRAFVVRSSWIFGPGKESFISTVHKHLRAGERVRAINDIWASVTYVDDLANAVHELIVRGKPGLYHVVNEGVVTHEMYAREAARLVGANDHLVEATASRESQKARRPRYSPMRSSVPMRGWKEALAAYVKS